MLSCTTVGQLLLHLDLGTSLHATVCSEVGDSAGARLFSRLQGLPLRRSHAVARLGSYSCRGGEPLAIRLQFAQEAEQLQHTFLHEIAHFLDHQTRSGAGAYRNPHGQSWQHWLRLLGAESGDQVAVLKLNNLFTHIPFALNAEGTASFI